jgi:hypothetical protein
MGGAAVLCRYFEPMSNGFEHGVFDTSEVPLRRRDESPSLLQHGVDGGAVVDGIAIP